MCGISTDVTAIKKLNSELVESNQFLSALMEAIPIPIFYKDTQGCYLGVNKAYEDFMGRTRNDMIGKFIYDLTQIKQGKVYHARDLQMMEQRGTQVYETQVTHGTGTARDVIFHKACFLSSTGEVRGLIGAILDITRRKQAEQVLQVSEQRASALYTLLRRVTDNVPDLIWAKDTGKRYLFANKAVCEQLLVAHDTDEPVGKDDLFFALRERELHADVSQWHTFGELCQDSDAITLQRGCASQFDEFGNVKGKLLCLDVRKAPLIGESGDVIGVVGTARDITDAREAQEKLQVSAMVLANSSEALLLTDADNRIVDINPAFTRLTGYTLDEIKGQNPRFLQSGKQGTDFYRSMWAQIEATGHWQGEVWNRRKDGQIFAEWLTINTLYRDDGSVHRRVGLFSDITEKKRSEELIWTQANFDTLTGLPNRRMFLDRLTQDMKKTHRGGFKLALMFLDLDHFKQVNDTLGHDVGDTLLAEAARRISSCTRESDTVARIGGDEFTVILGELADVGGIDRIANEIMAALAQPFVLGTEQVYVSVSIGITLYPDDATNQEDLLKNADQAMYVSKDAGRNRFSYFTSAMQISAQYRLHLLNDLRNALAEGQFELHYQPIVEMQTGRIHKAEALLRWFHPVRGPVSPAEFISLAEESGLIHEIGNWVFAQAVQQAQRWRAGIAPAFQISVNLSPLQIQSGSERFHWRHHLSAASLDGEAVVVEITEGLLLDKSPKVTAELLAFRDAGIQVAIDDFGTGYSAMAYLKQLDIDYLKIDQSFVHNLSQNPSDQALCEAMVVMAHKLGLKVIAEGVETPEQRDLLSSMGCDFGQGFLYSKAVNVQSFERLLATAAERGA
jgi:diguanylate cyclase (GGDEF)-like protein/PAS domain S-box-containing protein